MAQGEFLTREAEQPAVHQLATFLRYSEGAMSINLRVPEREGVHEMKPRIIVMGVGGAGGNAVNDMIASQLEGVEFLVANTDAQALSHSKSDRKIQIGVNVTGGLGAGAKPDIGRAAAEESMTEIMEHLDGCNMAFIAAGMGGGTGTGAAPVIAKACREKGILTVGVVTKPFDFEGVHRMRLADAGIEALGQHVDTLIVIPNQNLFRIANEKTTFADAFRMADEVLYSGVRGVTDLMIVPGMINLDFADIRSVMGEMGNAMMGTGEAEGDERATQAAEAAIANPLLDDSSMRGARGVLINITGGDDLTLYEVDEAAGLIRKEVDEEAYIIFGSALDSELQGKIRVSVVATGIDAEAGRCPAPVVLRTAIPEPEPAVSAAEDYQAQMFDRSDEMVSETETAATSADISPVVAEPVPMTSAVGTAVAENPSDALPNLSVATAPDIGHTLTKDERAAEAADEMSKRDVTDAFIPPKAIAPGGTEDAVPTKPFAVSDLVNGGKSTPSHKAPRLPGTRRAGNLLDRIMGKGNDKATRPGEDGMAGGVSSPATIPANQPIDWQNQTTAQVTGRAEPTMSTNLPPKSVSTGTDGSRHPIGVLDEASRMPREKPEEDLLDIPAFLRRQAN